MKITTKKGYGFFEVTSSFQKAIRRGEEAAALYWMVEFFNSGYENYVWKRIKIIASEDIGLAQAMLPATLHALHSSYEDLKKENKENRPERMYLTHAVLLLVRSKKSRLVDWTLLKIWREHESVNMPIPDYAHDMHTYTGKQKKRGLDHFYMEGTHLNNHHLLEGEEEMKLEARKWHEQYPGKLKFEKVPKGTLQQQNALFDAAETAEE